MKGIALAGVILMVIGLIGFGAGHIGFTTREKVVDFGPIQVTADKEHNLPIPDIAAGLALVAGLVMVVMGSRKA